MHISHSALSLLQGDRPSLDQEDVKAQFNSIALPYGIQFPEQEVDHDVKVEKYLLSEASTPDKELCGQSPFTAQWSDDVKGIQTGLEELFPEAESLAELLQAPWASTGSNHGVVGHEDAAATTSGNHQDKDDDEETDVEASGLDNLTGSPKSGVTRWRSLDGRDSSTIALKESSRGPSSKSGSKLAKGWKKLRASLRQNTVATLPQQEPSKQALYGAHSSVSEKRQIRSATSSSVGGGSTDRKAVSDMDSPLEFGDVVGRGSIEDMLGSRKGFKSGLGLRFRSGSLKSFLQKGSSTPSLHEVETGDARAVSEAEKDSKDGLQGGAVVVDVETIMELGMMRQYCKEDLIIQQQQQRHHEQQPSERHVLSEVDRTESGYGSSLSSMGSVAKGRYKHQPEPARTHPIQDAIDPAEDVSQLDSQTTQDDEDSTMALEHQGALGQELSSPVCWRLSMAGAPSVLGTICDMKPLEGHADEHYLHLLVRDSTYGQGTLWDKDTLEESDRLDKAFRVPLQQSVQLASATFENGYKVPLAIYYATDEICARVGASSAAVDEMFPEKWDEKDEAFEALVNMFDARPFGQGVRLSSGAPAVDGALSDSSQMESLVQSLEMERSTDEANHPTIAEEGPLGVTSKNLSRLILRFLNDLPDALIPQDVFTTFSAMVQLQTLDSIKIQASSLLIQMLAPEQRQLLQFVLEFLDDVVLMPLRNDIQRLEGLVSAMAADEPSSEDEILLQDLENLKSKLKESSQRLHRVLGVVCTHSISIKAMTGTHKAIMDQSQNSLYRHYKKDFEQRALQEQEAIEIQKAETVFRSLMSYRVSIFGPSSFQLGPLFTVTPTGDDSLESKASDTGLRRETGNLDKDVDVEGADHGTAYKNVHQPSRRPLSKKRGHTRRPLRSTRPHHWKKQRPLTKSRRGGPHPEISKAESLETLCDSAVDMTSNVDLLALAAMQKHAAMKSRANRHLTHPSVATLHSILVETDSVAGKKKNKIATNKPNVTGGTFVDLAGFLAVEDMQQPGTFSATSDDDLETTKDENDDDDLVAMSEKELELGLEKRTREIGFKDFLQEPMNRKHQEREVQMVEKEILRSELTTKFLAANLEGLYPASSPAPIPTVILPSARAMMANSDRIRGLRSEAGSSPREAMAPLLEEEATTPRSRELNLTPQEQVHLPSDHNAANDFCLCSYCTTMVKPSKIPVLTKAEYELAELQSQCDGKDQHVAELLKTVQHLQGQVNILNAKLLFLHDHHTTRPMRRRTLARNSYPAIQATTGGMMGVGSEGGLVRGGGWEGQQSPSMHYLQVESRAVVGNHIGSPVRATQAVDSSSSPRASGTPGSFAEGIIQRSVSDYTLENHANVDMPISEEDEDMSVWDLENHRNSRSSAPSFSMMTTPRGQDLRLSLSFATAAASSGQLGYFDRSNVNISSNNNNNNNARDPRYETELERALRDMDEIEEETEPEPEREGEDQLDEHYYLDAYKTMDQQLYRRPVLPVPAPPRPMSSEAYKKHHRMSLPIQSLMSKRISLGNSFRWKGRATAA